MEEMWRYVFIAATGGIAALAANKGVAVFNDGLRPLFPEYFSGSINRKALLGSSVAMSFILLISFGVPTFIATSIVLTHTIYLATDMIGLFFSDSPKGAFASLIFGALFGILLLFGMESLRGFSHIFPYNFLYNRDGGEILGLMMTPLLIAFAASPSIAVSKRFGVYKGAITAIVSLFVYILVSGGSALELQSTAAVISMAVGTVFLVYFSFQAQKPEDITTGNTDLVNIFDGNIQRLKKNWLLIALNSAFAGAACAMFLVAPDPTTQGLIAAGEHFNAAMVLILRYAAFLPLLFTTAVTSGVYSVRGAGFQSIAAILIGISFSMPLAPFIAAAVCFLMIPMELRLIAVVAKIMDKNPAIRELSDSFRSSEVLEYALLFGGILAVNAMMDNMGFLLVPLVYLINKSSKRPLFSMTIGPCTALAFGLIMNILVLLRLA
ncbi:MAG: YhfT family protein [Defluviitaleaceae bacterium]|nr:YhfT family protein [Defluviitaleaceae bacterium]